MTYSDRSLSSICRAVRSAFALAFLTAFLPGAALAQVNQGPLLQSEIGVAYDRGRNTSVLERERPEYEAIGVRVGGFLVYPRVEGRLGAASNVYGSRIEKRGDLYFVVDPSVLIESQWSSHRLAVEGGATFVRFATQTPRNETGYRVRGDGRLDVTRDLTLSASAGVQRAYEPTTSVGAPNDAAEPVPFTALTASLRAETSGRRVRFSVLADLRQLDFGNVRAFNGAIIDQGYRDNRKLRLAGQAEYALTPETAVYAQVAVSDIAYDQRFASGAPNLDAKEVRALAGASFDLTALLRGRAAIGYTRRNYDSALYRDFGGLAAEGRLEIFPSGLTTVTIGARRFIQESGIVGAEAYFANAAFVSVDHELLRNLLLNLRADYENDRFRLDARRDRVAQVSGGARYFASPSLGLGVTFSYTDRRSIGRLAGADFDDARAVLSIVVQR